MASNNYQLAIINPKVQDNYLVSEDTVTVHTFRIDYSQNCLTVNLGSISLIDDPTINCKLELYFSKYGTSNVNLSFLTEVPPAYEYEISLYYVNKANKLVHVSDLNVKNVRKNDKFEIPWSNAFKGNISVSYCASSGYHHALCIKISRKDILANFNKKPSLLLPTQITVLDDIEAEIFHEFLRYIYTNVVNDLNVHAEKLLMVAEKYDVPKLKSVCTDEMSRSLTVENVVRTLMIADRYSLQCLKDRAMVFIRNNIKSLLDTEEYKTLYKSGQAYLLKEIVQILA